MYSRLTATNVAQLVAIVPPQHTVPGARAALRLEKEKGIDAGDDKPDLTSVALLVANSELREILELTCPLALPPFCP